jgi:hypothetical protein
MSIDANVFSDNDYFLALGCGALGWGARRAMVDEVYTHRVL